MVVQSLFEHWLSFIPDETSQYEMYPFWQRLHGAEPPKGFAQWLLTLATTESRDRVADYLFREAVRFRTWRSRTDAPTLEELLDYVQRHPHFADSLSAELQCLIPEWRREQAEDDAERRRQRQAIYDANNVEIRKHLDEIRAGTAVSPLIYFAKAYFGFGDINHDLEPPARLLEVAGAPLVGAALEGFVAALQNMAIPSPREIGAVCARSKYKPLGYVILAGINIVASRSMAELMDLPNSTLQSALCFRYANRTKDSECRWAQHLITNQPDIAAPALGIFWRAHLACRASDIPGLYDLVHDEAMAGIARRIALPLLRDYSTCKEKHLESLLQAALRHANHAELLNLARDVLGRPGALKGAQRNLWFAVAFLLAPDEVVEWLVVYIAQYKLRAWGFLKFIVSFLSPGSDKDFSIPPRILSRIINVVTPLFPPEKDNHGFLIEHAQAVRFLIERLGNELTPEAVQALAVLRRNSAMAAYSAFLAHIIEAQARNRREAMYVTPTIDKIVEVLKGGRPANAADLRALVSAQLRVLADAIRNGPTNTYRNFWNIKDGKLTTPRPENEGRNYLLERLQPWLQPLGIAAEREGSYVEDKRSDIKVICDVLNLPVEIKRHYHKDLWTAPKQQLIAKYTRDPGASGYGVFLVLWFGEAKGRHLPKLPNGISRPTSAAELETALWQMVPDDYRYSIDVICIDCSPPANELQKAKEN